jgi:hypothetical protein
MSKDGKGKISTLSPHPLSSWFIGLDQCYSSKSRLANDGLLDQFPLHHKVKPLAIDLYDYWRARYDRQSRANTSLLRERARDLPQKSSVRRKRIIQAAEQYEELSDCGWFNEVYQLLLEASDVIPESKQDIFLKMTDLVNTLYPFVANPDGEDQSK